MLVTVTPTVNGELSRNTMFDDSDDDDDLNELFSEEKKPRKIRYPKCFVDSRHDGDPICKSCALELYDALPRKKFKYPRNCWNCEESGIVNDDIEEPFYEE